MRRLLFAALFLASGNASAAAYTFEILSAPGAYYTNVSGINDAGVVAGHSSPDGPGFGNFTGFTYDGSSFSHFSVPGARSTFSRGINSDGTVVGEFVSLSGESGAFIFDGVSFATVSAPGAYYTNLSGINDAGVVAGHSSPDGPGFGNFTGFTYDGSSFSHFSAPGARSTFSRGINSDGTVVGEFVSLSGESGAFIASVPEPATALLLACGILLSGWRAKRLDP